MFGELQPKARRADMFGELQPKARRADMEIQWKSPRTETGALERGRPARRV
jgi:hypothetical protein